MARGRKKDPTIPPTRALTLQRDYRARKSQYIADLEARCRAAEEENVRLRRELALARQGSASTLSPEMVRRLYSYVEPVYMLERAQIQASAELRNTLAAASISLSQFLNLAAGLPSAGRPPDTPMLALAAATQWDDRTSTVDAINHAASPLRSESPCCGGYLNCDGLVEEDPPPNAVLDDSPSCMARNISQLRSTSE
ncbi:hypothetical protein B0H10DRAFT_1941447 [Mycena sp. CBHHK59/15]|nr:hypothetical protein B0H10DRAFT_1941447 [Mycena sp. CBHHK59/15]